MREEHGSRFRDFLVSLTGTDPRDVANWAEAASPITLLATVLVNMAIALVTWWLAIQVMFGSLTPLQGAIGGLVGAMLVGVLDWIVISYHPTLPGWFISHDERPAKPNRILPAAIVALAAGLVALAVWILAAGLPPSEPALRSAIAFAAALLVLIVGWTVVSRQRPIDTTGRGFGDAPPPTVPPMPQGWARVAPYIPRTFFALTISVVIGLGVAIAMNQQAVIDQRTTNALAAATVKANQPRIDALKHNDQINGLHQEWVTRKNSYVEAEKQSLIALRAAEVRRKCENGERLPGSDCGSIRPSKEGYGMALREYETAELNWKDASKNLKDFVTSNPEPQLVPVPAAVQAAAADPALLEGFAPTIAAYFDAARERQWPWYVEFGAFLFFIVVDLVPVMLKVTMSYTAADVKRWYRQAEEAHEAYRRNLALHHRRLEEELRVQGTLGGLGNARIVQQQRDNAVRGAKDEYLVTARQVAEVVRPIEVKSAAAVAKLAAQAAKARAAFDLSRVPKVAGARPTADQGATPQEEPFFAADESADSADPAGDDEVPTAGWAQPGADEGAAQGAQEAPWLSRLGPPDWQDANGNGYVRADFFLSSSRQGYSYNDGSLLALKPILRYEDKDFGEVTEPPEKEFDEKHLLRKSGYFRALGEGEKAPVENMVGWWVSEYRPRGDLERFLNFLTNRGMAGSVTFWHACSWTLGVLRDVRGLHDAGFVHNDVKMRNALVEGLVGLGDRGRPELSGDLTLIDLGAVTPRQPPVTPKWLTWTDIDPVLLRDGISSPDTDTFEVVALLFNILTGEHVNKVISGASRTTELKERMTAPGWPAVYARGWAGACQEALQASRVPHDLAQFVLRGLHPDPQERFMDGDDLYRTLSDVMAGKSEAIDPVHPWNRPNRSRGYDRHVLEFLRTRLEMRVQQEGE